MTKVYFILTYLILITFNKITFARELKTTDPQFFKEIGYSAGFGLIGHLIIKSAYSNPNRRAQRNFPTQNFDNQVRRLIHGEESFEKRTDKEKRYNLISNTINGSVMAGTFTALWFTDPKHRLGKYLTFIHSFTMWVCVSDLLKASVARYRPRVYHNETKLSRTGGNATGSFPSGHAGEVFAVSTAASLLLNLNTSSKVILYTFATSSSLMRIASEDHFFTDICFGALLGVSASYLAYYLFEEKNFLGPNTTITFLPNRAEITYNLK